MHIITFLFMNIIVIASSFLFAYKLIRFSNFADSLISCFILYFSQIILTELILGICGILYLKNVILLNLIIFLILWLITRSQRFNFNSPGIKSLFLELTKNKIALFGISLIFAFGLVKVLINLVNPPLGWDSLNYHFTFPVEWLKQGNLNTPIVISDDPSPAYYPINGSLFYLWLMLPFRSVFLADLGQLPFFILAIMAVYNISRKLGLDRQFSFYAAALFWLIPNFFKQMQIAYVDVMVAGLFLAAINYLFAMNESFSWKNVFLYALSLGLLLGTKTVAFPYTVLLLVPFAYLLFRNLNKSYLLLLLILVIPILGAFSYLRNFWETGNPLYPLDFKLLGKTIFKGVMDTVTYSARFKPGDYNISKLLFHEGLGAQTLLFILPSLFLALPLTFIKRKKDISFNLIYFLILPIILYLVYRYVIPLANARYLYPLLGIGMILGFYTYNLLNMPRIIINILAGLCILASIPELAKRQELIYSLLLMPIVFFLLIPSIKLFNKYILAKKIALIILALILIFGLGISERHYLKNEYPGYSKMVRYSGFWPDACKAWDWLNRNTTADNVAYVGRPVPFPLYGANFKNNVYYVSVNKIDPAKLHYFPAGYYRWDSDAESMHKNFEEGGNYRSQGDYTVWLTNLKKRGTDYLFIYSLHHTKDIGFPIEDSWAKANPDKFSPVFINNTIHIYKVFK